MIIFILGELELDLRSLKYEFTHLLTTVTVGGGLLNDPLDAVTPHGGGGGNDFSSVK